MRFLGSLLLALGLSLPAAAADIELLNVYDAFGKPPKGAQLDFGFGAVVKFGGKTYLFDGGANADILRKNLQAMGVSVGSIDVVVLSHKHHDHAGGVDYILDRKPEVELYAPKDFALGAEIPFDLSAADKKLAKKMSPEDCYLGDCTLESIPVRSSGRYRKAKNLKYVDEVTEIAEGVKIIPTEAKKWGAAYGGAPKPMPELSLGFKTAEGAVVLVGCSHSGVDVIAKAAKKELGELALVAGGFHYASLTSAAIRSAVAKLKKVGVKSVAPAHCTGYAGREQLKKSFKTGFLPFGLGWRIGG